ncbi:hypothetical protein BH10PSE4_BH10PSE4_22240 [soil metagenome]
MRLALQSPRPWRRLIGLVAFAALLAPSSALSRADAPTAFQVKAAFLSKFGDFIDWPQDAFADPAAPAVLCVVGDDPFGAALDRVALGQTIHGRAIVVRRVRKIERASGCHLAYLGGAAQDTANALRVLEGAPVLTITDQGGEDGRGMIDFTLRDNRVRFRIDDASAARHGLTISSKLLALALSVRPR